MHMCVYMCMCSCVGGRVKGGERKASGQKDKIEKTKTAWKGLWVEMSE